MVALNEGGIDAAWGGEKEEYWHRKINPIFIPHCGPNTSRHKNGINFPSEI